MPASWKTVGRNGWGLLMAVALAADACSAPITHPQRPSAPLTLTEPTTVSVNVLSLAVGTNCWPAANTRLEETFLPIAVTVRNTDNRTLCGGVTSAVLSDAAGASVSASSPEGVLARLFGPVARHDSAVGLTPSATVEADARGLLLFVHGSHGSHAGGISHGSHGVPHAFAPSPRSFGSPFVFSPFASPGFPFYYSPFSRFTSPFPPRYPYDGSFSRYGFAPVLPAEVRPYDEAPSEDEHTLINEIFTTAFANRPLAPQEARSGFLFFPLPIPMVGATQLHWGWYDCATRELVAQLSTPIIVPKRV